MHGQTFIIMNLRVQGLRTKRIVSLPLLFSKIPSIVINFNLSFTLFCTSTTTNEFLLSNEKQVLQ